MATAANSATSAGAAKDAPPTPVKSLSGVVKQVLSGDTVVIRATKGAPPPEKQITFSHVLAPKLARRPGAGGDETKDEPWAWESREFLRKKLIGVEVTFTFDKPANSNREYGFVWIGKDKETGENVVESIVREGLVSVRREGRPTPEQQTLIELEDQARAAGRGKWATNASPADKVRNIKWSHENPAHLVDIYEGKPVKAIIEHVRDGSTVRAFLLPDFHYITLMISGIRCPGVKLDADGKPDLSVKVPFADEARYYVETRLLQRDVEIRLESVNNSNFIGTILYPKGNIAESLLREGLAKCVDWSMAVMKTGADKLRATERIAKEKRLRQWQDYQAKTPAFNSKEKDFSGTVVEVFNGDAINVRLSNGLVKKVFFSSIRPPRDQRAVVGTDGEEIVKAPPRGKNYRPLYEIPHMFDAREFLRKKLINKKVQCNLDYISPPRENFPEKYCYTVSIGGQNVAEAMVAKGLATCVRYRQDDDQRSSAYDQLIAAEQQAIKGLKGLHAKKDNATLRVNDLTVDHSRIKVQYLPSWQRALRTEAIVEFVASGSRLRLFVPKDSCLVTFLLAGISCPRSSRPALNGVPAQEGEPFGDEALTFTRERVLQRDVSVHIDTTDKAGSSVIGWLWTDSGVNLSVALVEEGLAEVHFSAEKSEYYRQLKSAEDRAKAAKKNIWANYVEQVPEEKTFVDDEKEDKLAAERKVNFENVIVTEVTETLTFFAQSVENGSKLESLMSKLHADFQSNPPIAGSYTPKRGDLVAAQFTLDNQWYRAKVERVQGSNATVLYIDYGNKETLPTSRLAALPSAFSSEKPYATEYALALVALPTDNEDKEEALRAFSEDVLNHKVQLNVELKVHGSPNLATLHDPTTKADFGKQLVAEGLVLAEKRRERKLKDLVDQYKAAQETARAAHLAIWKYGDITQDDAPEFR
ncbi:staphylococcal nuclease domain-containing protein 1 [Drosophila ficusphila]|uniref:staphylococcal nuclease domain-containing protein 1 n=1 Tax=Drosophila ficusphila TaxID=30025 RepID=UPI0007E5DC9F|nr:staphylococcal nuclease domain-containing protein 1 [Drosophila ficusphila]